jgi:hypothetical protein
MPDDPPDTRVSLEKYIDRIFEEKQLSLNQIIESQREALNIATASLNRELGHLNDLRAQKVDKEEYEARYKAVEERLSILERNMETQIGRKEGSKEVIEAHRALLLAVISSAIAVATLVASLFFHH